MTIINTLPVVLANGTLADATQVMADFNQIVSNVNANAAQLAGGNAFTGTQTIGGDTIATLNALQTRYFYSGTSFGLVGDGVTDNTTNFQTAINTLQSITIAGDGNGRPSLFLPAGIYLTGPLTISKRLRIWGEGSGSCFIKLKAFAATGNPLTDSLFIVNAEDVGGTSIDDANHNQFEHLTLQGNRVDSITTGVSHGVYCPDTAWGILTQYSASVQMTDVHIENFTGDGLLTGVNRNWALLHEVIIRYCNDNGWASYGYDHRATSCDFGVHKNIAFREFAGGANIFTGCNFYFCTINYVSNSSSNSFSEFNGCSFDFASQNGVSLSAPVAAPKKFLGCRFYGNSTAGANLYSDLLITGTGVVASIIGCSFLFAVQRTKYLVETSNAPTINFQANDYNKTGASIPYSTGVSNTLAMIYSADSTTLNVMQYGVVGDGSTDDSAALNAAFAAAAGTGKTVFLPYASYACASQIVIDRCRVIGDDVQLIFSGIGAGVDCVDLQGSTTATPLVIEGVKVNANSVGRDAVRISGGNGSANNNDHMRIGGMLIQGAVRDGLHLEPSGNNRWIQNPSFRDVKVLNPGRHSFAMVVSNFTNSFINNGTWIECESRGAGQVTAGSYDIFMDLQGSTSAQQIGAHSFITCEFDTAGAANHAQGSINLSMTGTNGFYTNLNFFSCIFEDVGGTITGFPTVIAVTGAPTIVGINAFWAGSKYGQFADVTKVTGLMSRCGATNRDILMFSMGTPGFSASFANDAAAAAAGIAVGQLYRNGSTVSIRVT